MNRPHYAYSTLVLRCFKVICFYIVLVEKEPLNNWDLFLSTKWQKPKGFFSFFHCEKTDYQN